VPKQPDAIRLAYASALMPLLADARRMLEAHLPRQDAGFNPSQLRDLMGRWTSTGDEHHNATLNGKARRVLRKLSQYAGKQFKWQQGKTDQEIKEYGGRLGESVAVAFLRKTMRQKDARRALKHKDSHNNFPVDGVSHAAHVLYEFKTGIASSGTTRWRTTIGQSKGDTKVKALPGETPAFTRDRLITEAINRKIRLRDLVSKKTGTQYHLRTIGMIYNPDAKTVDVHVIEGVHRDLGWTSELARKSYYGTYRYVEPKEWTNGKRKDAADEEITYAEALAEMDAAMVEALRDLLTPEQFDAITPQEWEWLKGARERADASNWRQAADQAREEWQREWPNSRIAGIPSGVGRRVSEFNLTQLRENTKAALGLDIIGNDPEMPGRIGGWVEDNVALIQTVPERYFDEVEEIIAEAYANGVRPEDIADTLVVRFNVAQSNATRIARDQVGKLNGELDGFRQQDAGVSHYFWRTMGDNRVRDSHHAREGKRFAWDEPPEGGHPGQDINCRCYAEPDLSPLLEE
jgi:SPP1 gp7 family putative phage head morphogenesis protein